MFRRGMDDVPFSVMMRRYVDRVVRLGSTDAAARLAFLEVLHVIRRPMALFRPSLLIEALFRKNAVPPLASGAPTRELAAA